MSQVDKTVAEDEENPEGFEHEFHGKKFIFTNGKSVEKDPQLKEIS